MQMIKITFLSQRFIYVGTLNCYEIGVKPHTSSLKVKPYNTQSEYYAASVYLKRFATR